MATAFHLVNNNAEGTLNAAIDDNDLSAVLSSGQGAEFDATKQYLTIGRNGSYAGEIVDVTSRSSDTFTIATRGVDGTTAVSHEAGDRVECLLVAAHITEIQNAINAIENGTVFLAQVKLGDDTGKLIFGTDSDIQFLYDEATDDRLEITDGTNVLAYFKDLGTTGMFGVTGRAELPQIGIAVDTDLLTLTANLLTIEGNLTANLASGTNTLKGTNVLGDSGGSKDIHFLAGANNTVNWYISKGSNSIRWKWFCREDNAAGTTTAAMVLQAFSLAGSYNRDVMEWKLVSPFGIVFHDSVALNGAANTMGNASTDLFTFTGRCIFRTVTDAGPMTATGGTQAEVVFNSSDSKFYGCTVSHASAATWVAFH